MTDMLSEVRAPLVQAPISWVARRLLACDASVNAVMVMAADGKVLAHERAVKDDDFDCLVEEDRPMLFYASGPKLFFYVRVDEQPDSAEISNRIMTTISSPSFAMTP